MLKLHTIKKLNTDFEYLYEYYICNTAFANRDKLS